MEEQQNRQQSGGQQAGDMSPERAKQEQLNATDEAESHDKASQVSPPPPEEVLRAASPEESRHELQEAIKGSNDILAKSSTTLTLFPDTLTVDRAKLTVTKRTFLQTAEVMSMRIEDILNVTATVGPLFGSIKIVSRVLNAEKPYTIGRFWRSDAIRLKRITQGYVIALQRHIDCSALPTAELVRMLDSIGEDEHAT